MLKRGVRSRLCENNLKNSFLVKWASLLEYYRRCNFRGGQLLFSHQSCNFIHYDNIRHTQVQNFMWVTFVILRKWLIYLENTKISNQVSDSKLCMKNLLLHSNRKICPRSWVALSYNYHETRIEYGMSSLHSDWRNFSFYPCQISDPFRIKM